MLSFARILQQLLQEKSYDPALLQGDALKLSINKFPRKSTG
jgi:hypothetical protein